MILARIFKQHTLMRLLPSYRFSSEAELKKPNSVISKIIQIQNWKEFTQLFSSNRASFTIETLSQNSKHIITLLSREKDSVSFEDLREITRFIEGIDLTTLPERNIIGLLAIFRSFSHKGFDVHNKLKTQLCTLYVQALNARGDSKQDSNDLAMAYFEMAHAQNINACRAISERLLARVNREPDNHNIFASVQSIFLLHTLSARGELLFQQRRLRTYFLGCLRQKVDLLKLSDVVKIVSYINKMDILDMEPTDFQHLKIFTQRILANITDLEEHSIFEFLREKSAGRHPLILKIYEEFVKNIYAEIEQSGATQMNHNTVLKMLALISFNFDFRRLSEIQRKKHLNFLQVIAKNLEEEKDFTKIRYFYFRVEDLIKNDFFERNKIKEYSALFNINNQVPSIGFLETFFEKHFDVQIILQNIIANPPKFSNEFLAFKHALVVTRISRAQRYSHLKDQLELYLQTLTKRIEESYQNPQKFVVAFREVLRQTSKLDLRPFHDIYHEFFERLPNPFEIAQSESTFSYRLAYFQYLLHSFKYKDLNTFLSKYEGQIKSQLIHKVIQSHVFYQQDNRLVQPSRMLVNLAQRRLSDALEKKEKAQIQVTIILVQRYSRFVIMGNVDSHVIQNIFRIIHTLIHNVELLNEMGHLNLLQNVVEKYISRNYKNYNNDINYRDLLHHLLRKMNHFKNYTNMLILEHGLRLNLITKQNLEGVEWKKVHMSYLKKAMIQYINDNKYVPTINKITIHSLKVLFHNRNCLEFLIQNQAAVFQAIRSAYPNQLYNLLLYFNLPLNRQTASFISAIYTELGQKDQNIERVYLLGSISHILDKNLYHFFGCKKLTEKIVESVKNRIHQFSLTTHYQILRLIISQSGYNPGEYYKKLVEWTEKNASENELLTLLYKLSYTNYGSRPEDIKHTRNMIKRTPFQGIYYFLVNEQLFEEKERKEIVSEIVEVLNKSKKTDKLIQTFQYDYLKAVYPQQTKSLSLQHESLQKYWFAPKPKASVTLLLQEIAKAHQTTLGTLDIPAWGDDNHIFRIKDWVFIFYNPKRNGAYFEHEFIKRGLAQFYKQKGEELKPIYIGNSRGRPLLAYLQKQSPELITQEIQEKIKEYFEKVQPEKEEEGNHENKSQKKPREFKQRAPKENKKSKEGYKQKNDFNRE